MVFSSGVPSVTSVSANTGSTYWASDIKPRVQGSKGPRTPTQGRSTAHRPPNVLKDGGELLLEPGSGGLWAPSAEVDRTQQQT